MSWRLPQCSWFALPRSLERPIYTSYTCPLPDHGRRCWGCSRSTEPVRQAPLRQGRRQRGYSPCRQLARGSRAPAEAASSTAARPHRAHERLRECTQFYLLPGRTLLPRYLFNQQSRAVTHCSGAGAFSTYTADSHFADPLVHWTWEGTST